MSQNTRPLSPRSIHPRGERVAKTTGKASERGENALFHTVYLSNNSRVKWLSLQLPAQAVGGKNTRARTSMLSRGGAAAARGFSNAV